MPKLRITLRSNQSLMVIGSLALLGVACDSSDSIQLGSVHVTSLAVGPDGGQLSVGEGDHPLLAGTNIVIPAGALASETKITIGYRSQSITDDDGKLAGPVVELGPDGTQFARPAILTIPYLEAFHPDRIRVYVQSGGTTTVMLPFELTYSQGAKTVTFEVSHFTNFQSGLADQPCSHVANCDSNLCVAGRCVNACGPEECPPRPLMPAIACVDGSIAGPECVRLPDGSCGWVHDPCPDPCDAIDCPVGYECQPVDEPATPDRNGSRACCDANGNCIPNNVGCEHLRCEPGTHCVANSDGARCVPDACDPSTTDGCYCNLNECSGGPPEMANWTCEDGGLGGPTGRCIRTADSNQCEWEINWCPRGCALDECGPRPEVETSCPSGDPAEPVCTRLSNGQCGWDFPCPDCGIVDPSGNDNCSGQCSDETCPAGTVCDPNTGACNPIRASCGRVTCGEGDWCCNSSCGFCVPIGEGCTEQACNLCNGTTCPPGVPCDPNGCSSQAVPCGLITCQPDQYCCNPSCSICATAGETCIQGTCESCVSGTSCPPGTTCDPNDPSGCTTVTCAAADCGPQLGMPTWICEDGSTGGPTGNCIPGDTPGACVWEINWCPRRCESSECPPIPNDNSTSEICSDSTTPELVCRRDDQGDCRWRCQ